MSIKRIEVDIFRIIYVSHNHLSLHWRRISARFLCFLHRFCWFAVLNTNLAKQSECFSSSGWGQKLATKSAKDPNLLLTRCLWLSWTTLSQEWKRFTQRLIITVFISTLNEVKGKDASRSRRAHRLLWVKQAAAPVEQCYKDLEHECSTRVPWKAHKLANYSN